MKDKKIVIEIIKKIAFRQVQDRVFETSIYAKAVGKKTFKWYTCYGNYLPVSDKDDIKTINESATLFIK